MSTSQRTKSFVKWQNGKARFECPFSTFGMINANKIRLWRWSLHFYENVLFQSVTWFIWLFYHYGCCCKRNAKVKVSRWGWFQGYRFMCWTFVEWLDGHNYHFLNTPPYFIFSACQITNEKRWRSQASVAPCSSNFGRQDHQIGRFLENILRGMPRLGQWRRKNCLFGWNRQVV